MREQKSGTAQWVEEFVAPYKWAMIKSAFWLDVERRMFAWAAAVGAEHRSAVMRP